MLDSVYSPKEISDESLSDISVQQGIPSGIKLLPPESSEDKLPIGDVDGNGDVSSIDFAFMRMHLLGMVDEFKAEDDIWVSDVKGDGIFNSLDFAFMRMYLLGKILEFPKEKLNTSPTPTSVQTPVLTATVTHLKPDLRILRLETDEGSISQSSTINAVVQNIGEDMDYNKCLEIEISIAGYSICSSIYYPDPFVKNECRTITFVINNENKLLSVFYTAICKFMIKSYIGI